MTLSEVKYNIRYGYSATGVFLFLFLLLFILMTLAGGSTNVEVLTKFGASSADLVLFKHEYFRLVTNAFLHIGLMHLLFNTFAFLYIARFVEDNFGLKKLAGVFIFTAICASLLSVISSYFSNPFIVGAGASGGIFGLTGLLLGNTFRKNTYNYDLGLDRTRLIGFIFINLVIGFSISGIDNAAHIGGLIAGFLIGLILNPKEDFSNSKIRYYSESVFSIICIAVACLSFIALIIHSFILTN